MTGMSLTLGPVRYNWPVDSWRDFYFRIAEEAPLDIVYVGETICSKRQPFFNPVIPEVLERLQGCGKQVVLSTLALISLPREERQMLETTDGDDFTIEANDITALPYLRGKPHVIGPYVNVYNEGTAALLNADGATRICLPAELGLENIRAIAQATGIELEIQVFGRLPLALSARCYHARAHNLHKDNCRYVCDRDPDGMEVSTIDGKPFLTVNGIQTQTGKYASLAGDFEVLKNAGASHFRLWPQHVDMVAVAARWRALLDGSIDGIEAERTLSEICGHVPFENGFLHASPGHRHVPAQQPG